MREYWPTLNEIEEEIERLGRKRRRKSWRRLILTTLILALCAGGYMAKDVVSLYTVNGNSMEKTLQSGDVVLCRLNAEVARGDIVAFERDGLVLIKRVIALGGDTVTVSATGRVYVNGAALEETYVASPSSGNGDITYPFVVPEGELFVMGDHRSTSVDSRNSSIGAIREDEILGCVWLRLWPAYRIKALTME